MRYAASLASLCLLGFSFPASTDPGEDRYLKQIELAIAGGRLIQADRMLSHVKAQPENASMLTLLKADLLLALHSDAKAYALYAELAGQQPENTRAATGAGIAALRLQRYEEAHRWLLHATALAGADWRAWNGLGISSDFQRDWALSEKAYRQAIAAAPSNAVIWNNFGYSLLCQHRLGEAVSVLQKAQALAPKMEKIQANLDDAMALTGQYPQARRPGETARAWASRLNNAGYMALLNGDKESARSFFARAIKASDVSFPRAEANLRLVEAAQ